MAERGTTAWRAAGVAAALLWSAVWPAGTGAAGPDAGAAGPIVVAQAVDPRLEAIEREREGARRELAERRREAEALREALRRLRRRATVHPEWYVDRRAQLTERRNLLNAKLSSATRWIEGHEGRMRRLEAQRDAIARQAAAAVAPPALRRRERPLRWDLVEDAVTGAGTVAIAGAAGAATEVGLFCAGGAAQVFVSGLAPGVPRPVAAEFEIAGRRFRARLDRSSGERIVGPAPPGLVEAMRKGYRMKMSLGGHFAEAVLGGANAVLRDALADCTGEPPPDASPDAAPVTLSPAPREMWPRIAQNILFIPIAADVDARTLSAYYTIPAVESGEYDPLPSQVAIEIWSLEPVMAGDGGSPRKIAEHVARMILSPTGFGHVFELSRDMPRTLAACVSHRLPGADTGAVTVSAWTWATDDLRDHFNPISVPYRALSDGADACPAALDALLRDQGAQMARMASDHAR